MKQTNPRLWVALPTAVLAGFANITLFFLFMAVYGHLLDPGHEDVYYQQAANRFGPYASIVGGIPVFFVTGLLLRRFFGQAALKVALATWAIYLAIDLAIVIAVGQFIAFMPHIVVSFATKLAAIFLGARISRDS